MSQQNSAADPLFLAFQLALAGRYSIDRELGRGGMGVVYLAREVHLDRLVAIKLLPPDKANQPSLRERFLREARLAAKLSHPHIVPIHAVAEDGGFVYYVMSFVNGETLAQRVRSRGPLSASDGARILREVAWALGFAHDQGVIHRDVKPDNILLELSSGRALVADFGIAGAIGDVITSGVSGTPEFMSPEQALGEESDARSDIYGLGVTAFYAFSGRFPFEGQSATEILAKQVAQPAPPLSSMGVGVPRKLAALVDKCLAKEPAERPASASALAEQLGVTMEQRRELPAALRAFVRRNGRMDGGGSLLYAVGLLTSSIATGAIVGPVTGFLTLAVGGLMAPALFAVAAARKLARLGFAHADLAPAFRAEIESSREERAVDRGFGRSSAEAIVAWIAKVSGSYALLAAPAVAVGLTTRWSEVARLATPITGVCALVAAVSSIVYIAILQARRDVDTEFWSGFWHTRVGRYAFAVARRLRGGQQVNAAMTHRATELSLGIAAEQLYEALPREVRQSIGDLPSLLARLQRDAQALRSRYEELNDVLTRMSTITAAEQYEHLRQDRSIVHEKLGQAVGAMETIRLNLLRLHAGTAGIEGLTTHIGIAENISAEVERLIAARAEVDADLNFPRQVEPTPA
jgi:eukaryotic-like serine/threonine-protein kinase